MAEKGPEEDDPELDELLSGKGRVYWLARDCVCCRCIG